MAMELHCYEGTKHTVGVFNLYDRLFLMEQSFNSFMSGFHLVSVAASFAGGFDKCKFHMKIFVLPELVNNKRVTDNSLTHGYQTKLVLNLFYNSLYLVICNYYLCTALSLNNSFE